MHTNKCYDAIIIGFGKGGKTLAGALGNAGKRTLLIEQSPDMYGGTCINVGCIPTKFLVHKAAEARHAKTPEEKQTLYREAIEQELGLTAKLRSKNLQKAENTPNVTVLTGVARLLSETSVEVTTESGIEVLEGTRIFINTGSTPFIPPIEGLQNNTHVVTSDQLLKQTKRPDHLVIIGGGYIGVEFASVYADFGSHVTIIQDTDTFLPREDRDIAATILENLVARGIELITSAMVKRVSEENGNAMVSVLKNGNALQIVADTVLVATGRKPNTAHLGLENVGIRLNNRGGIQVNEHLQTTLPHIYAMGDVIGGLQFTYISLDDFRVVRSAVLGDGSYTTHERGAVPYSVFTNPPFARVGINEEEARARGHAVKIARLPAAAIPKALVKEQPTGLLKAIVDEETDRILGAHLFCEDSHEVINLIKLAMDADLPYTHLRDMIFTHPTMSEALNELFNI